MTEKDGIQIWSSVNGLSEKLSTLPDSCYLEWGHSGHAITIFDENDIYIGYVHFLDGTTQLYLSNNDWDESEE